MRYMQSGVWLVCLLLCQSIWGQDLIVLEIESPAAFERLSHILADVEPPKAGQVRAYVDAKEQARLQAAGWTFRVEIKNLSDFYRQRAANSRRSRLGASMGGFRTFAEIEQALDWLAATFPNWVSQKFSLGLSVEGRPLWAVRISDNPNQYEAQEPTVWFDALHHAREPMSAEALLRFAYDLARQYEQDDSVQRLIQSRNIILLPCANPDGYVFNQIQYPNGGGLWRKNRQLNMDGSYGVDLNRNYGWQWGRSLSDTDSSIYGGTAAFSEPETAAIRDFLRQQPPSMSVSVHAYGNEWMFPWGSDYEPSADDALLRHYANLLVANNGYVATQATDLYGLTFGASDDYHYAEYGSLAYTVEIGNHEDGFWPDPARIPILFDAVQQGFKQTAQWAGAWGVWHPPIWQQVSGNGDNYFDAGEHWQLQLQLENQGLMPLQAQISLHTNNAGIQLRENIFQWQLAPRQQGVSGLIDVVFAAQLDTNEPYSLELVWDYEEVHSYQRLDLDLAKSRILSPTNLNVWQSNNLLSTDLGCWRSDATEQASLSSPRFQAGELGHIHVSYRRWFTDAVLQFAVSNDDGLSWLNLEHVRKETQWAEVEFDLENYLPLSAMMRFRFHSAKGFAAVCIKDFVINTQRYLPTLGVWGSFKAGETLQLLFDGSPLSSIRLFGSIKAGIAQSMTGIEGSVYLQGDIVPLLQGLTDAKGRASRHLQLPDKLDYTVETVYLQALLQAQTSQLLAIPFK